MREKIIVFDLDNTIGYFKQLISISHIVKESTKENIDYINYLLNLFPEFFRPNIFDLFEFLIIKRKEKKIKRIILYTNNNNDLFINKVIEFIHSKLYENLFDIIITPTHERRTKKYKDYNDLLECSSINKDTSICFIDDKKHINMINEKVFYIQCESYNETLKTNDIYKRINIHVDSTKNKYKLNRNNQKRVTEQLFNRIKWFIDI
jgi:mitochondrial fission protein ELM1